MEWTYINGIVFASDVCHWPDDTVDRRVEAMVVLRCEPENADGATVVAFSFSAIGVTK